MLYRWRDLDDNYFVPGKEAGWERGRKRESEMNILFPIDDKGGNDGKCDGQN